MEEVIHKNILEKTSFYRQVVNDAIKKINSGGQGYCFSLDQLKDIKNHFRCDLKIRDDDGIYYIRKEKKNER